METYIAGLILCCFPIIIFGWVTRPLWDDNFDRSKGDYQ